jgi:RHS repeat-associated protein
LGDHLGSTSLTLDAGGNKVAEQRYKPWGSTRYEWGTAQTNYQYTGQRKVELGIYYYQARFYDAALGQFMSPDTIIPSQGNVLDWNRYLYGRANPLKYTDPSGHDPNLCLDGQCGEYRPQRDIRILSEKYGITFSEGWSTADKLVALIGAIAVAGALSDYTGLPSIDSFQAVFGNLTFARSEQDPGCWGFYSSGTITFYAKAQKWTTLVAHELGHAFNARIANNGGETPYNTLYFDGIWAKDGTQVAGFRDGYVVPGTGFTCNGQCYDDKGVPIQVNPYYRTYRGTDFHHSKDQTRGEDFADTFANWVTGKLTDDKYGRARLDFMTTNMSEWVTAASGK